MKIMILGKEIVNFFIGQVDGGQAVYSTKEQESLVYDTNSNTIVMET